MNTVKKILIITLFCIFSTQVFSFRDLYSDTWVATDELGRSLPDKSQCPDVRTDRTAGIFYFIWLYQHSKTGPYDITRLLSEDPENPNYGPAGAFHHWGQSELGYYRSDDPYIIKKHLWMLNDAGIDTLIFDVTNAVTYENVYLKICEIYTEMRKQGHRTPQLCFITHSASQKTITKLYNDFYSKNLYPDLWFYWKGKPLILGVADGLDPKIKDFFTIRDCWAWTHGRDKWQWLDHSENRYGWHESPDKPEEISVSVAQHPVSNIGRSYRNKTQPPIDKYGLTGTEANGYYFQEQWDRALKIDPEFVFITGWNEWVAQRFIKQKDRAPSDMMGKKLTEGQTYFVDAYNQQYNRDIEPMKDGHTDNYYYQLVSNVRRYKGVRPLPVADKDYKIRIDGRFNDWDQVAPEFRDTIGDTIHRNEQGWGDAGQYTNTTGRNDFVNMKVACDSDNVYFYVETADDMTSSRDNNWMLLFIDIDSDSKTGWKGYDFLINHEVVDTMHTEVKFTDAGWNWKRKGRAKYRLRGNKLEMSVPKSVLNISGSEFTFDFHWADNIQKPDDIIEFSISGDSAPNRRFNYRFIRN